MNIKMREQKGSITFFTLASMVFFTMIVIALYVNTNTKAQAQQKEIEKIQQSYQKYDINDVYYKTIE